MRKRAWWVSGPLAAFIGALWIKAIYPASSGIADTDFFWHLAYGRWILEHGQIPLVDTFSWTFAGTPYRLTQWLGETIMGAAYQVSGLQGTLGLSVLLTAATIGLGWSGAKRHVPSAIAMGIAIVCNLVLLVSPMRPQLFTFAFVALTVWLLDGWLTYGRRRYLVVFPLLMMFWVNLHGGFVIGLVLIACTALGRAIEANVLKSPACGLRAALPLLVAAGAGAIATLANPHGHHVWEVVAMIGQLHSSNVISEWMPVNLTTTVGAFYLVSLLSYIGVMLATPARPRAAHAVLAAFLLIFGVLANRQVAICSAGMPILLAALFARIPQLGMIELGDGRYRPAFTVAVLAMAACLFPIQSFGINQWRKHFDETYPASATRYLKQAGLTHRVLSDTLEASYLIWERVPVFVDGRMDLYRDKFYFDWYYTARAVPGWNDLLKRYKPEALLLRHEMALRQVALASGAWRQVWSDNRYSVLVPKQDAKPVESYAPKIAFVGPDGEPVRRYLP